MDKRVLEFAKAGKGFMALRDEGAGLYVGGVMAWLDQEVDGYSIPIGVGRRLLFDSDQRTFLLTCTRITLNELI